MPVLPRPTGVERSFGPDEVIVSKTDLQGRLTYANDVFCRMAAMAEGDLLGQPHNVIRHPEMPRAVFRLLWDEIRAGREIFAYVVNLAADGAHYWVLAHVTPSTDLTGQVVGYHSNRRRPAPAAVREVQALYRRLLDEERRHPSGPAAAEAGLALLDEHVRSLGTSYDELVWRLASRSAA